MKQVPKVADVFGVEYYPVKLKQAFQRKFFPKRDNPLHLKKSFCYKKFDLKNCLKQRHNMIDYLNRKALAQLFQKKIPQNAVLVMGLGGSVSLMMDKHFLLSLKLHSLATGLPKFEDIQVEQLSLSRVVYRTRDRRQSEAGTSAGEFVTPELVTRNISFPVLRDEFFWMVFEISKQVFDRDTFWAIFRDLFDNHVFRPHFPSLSFKENAKIKSQFAQFSESSKELVMGYFCFLLTFENFNSEIFK